MINKEEKKPCALCYLVIALMIIIPFAIMGTFEWITETLNDYFNTDYSVWFYSIMTTTGIIVIFYISKLEWSK